jgi:hypothetical protein
MELPSLKPSYLVGGTALSLLFGHRISIDLDLFIHSEFKRDVIMNELKLTFGKNFEVEEENNFWGIFGYIANIKVDIVKYPHPLLAEPMLLDGIRMYHTDDIVAMKINAILGRGKKKDFWDLAELSNHYTVAQMIELYHRKFPSQQLLISIPQALTYFDDADEGEDPIGLKGQTWEGVKTILKNAVRQYLS